MLLLSSLFNGGSKDLIYFKGRKGSVLAVVLAPCYSEIDPLKTLACGHTGREQEQI